MNRRLAELEEENRKLRAELGRAPSPAPSRPGFVVELLGVPRAARIAEDGSRHEIVIRLRRAWRALALLALAPGQRVGREELMRTLWPDAGAARVRRNLPPTIYALRRSLGTVGGWTPIAAEGNLYALSPRLEWRVDALDFDHALERGRSAEDAGRVEAAAEWWERALALARGPFLAGDDDPWIEELRERFGRRRLELLRFLGDLHLRQGALERALDAYRLSLAEEPLQEELHRVLLRIYALQGRRDLVRRHFDRFSRLLADDLGVEPGLEITLEYHRLMASGER